MSEISYVITYEALTYEVAIHTFIQPQTCGYQSVVILVNISYSRNYIVHFHLSVDVLTESASKSAISKLENLATHYRA